MIPPKTSTDGKGNKLIISTNGKITLELRGAKYPRAIGQIVNDVLYMRRDREKHYHVKAKGYGFNSELLQYLKEFNIDMKIIIKMIKEKITYTTTVKQILDEGKYLYFAEQGFERQVFLEQSRMELGLK